MAPQTSTRKCENFGHEQKGTSIQFHQQESQLSDYAKNIQSISIVDKVFISVLFRFFDENVL